MSSSPAFGNFDELNLPTWDREMIQSGFEAVNSVDGGWDFLKNYEPPQDQGFMFSKPPPKQEEIDAAIEKRYGGHSGSSYGMTMRILQYIAKNGWDTYAKDVLNKYGPPKNKEETMEDKRKRFLALPKNMTLAEQWKAVMDFKDVPMSYSEMRERFG